MSKKKGNNKGGNKYTSKGKENKREKWKKKSTT
jgi:hypothetical protein